MIARPARETFCGDADLYLVLVRALALALVLIIAYVASWHLINLSAHMPVVTAGA